MASNGSSMAATAGLVIGGPMNRSAAMQQISPQLDVQALKQWLLEQSEPTRGSLQCVRFTLAHYSERGLFPLTEAICPKGKGAATIGDEERLDKCEHIAAEFEQASKNAAWGANGKTQRFFVGAHLTNDKDEAPRFNYIFLVTPPPEVAQYFESSEGPSLPGVIGNLQRLLDTSIRLLSSNLQSDKDRMLQQLQDQQVHIEKLYADRWSMVQEREQLADAKDLRALQLKKGEKELELEYLLYNALAQYGMKFLAKVTGEAGPNPMLEFVKQVEPSKLVAFIASMSETEKAAFEPLIPSIIGSMDEGRKKAFHQALMEHAARQAAKEHAARQAAKGDSQ